MSRRPAVAAVTLTFAVLAVSPTAVLGDRCEGSFECSETVDLSAGDDLSYYASGGGALTCRYGHIETEGHCETPCEGTRYAQCRCKSKTEAEEHVAEDAQTKLYISVGIAVFGSLCCFMQVKKMRANETGLPFEKSLEQGESPYGPQVVQATVVGDSNQPQGNATIARQPSRIEQVNATAVRNPRKALLITGLISIGAPALGIGIWAQHFMESDVPIDQNFRLTVGLAAIAVYFTVFAIVLLWMISRPGFIEKLRSAPLLIFVVVWSRVILGAPIVGAVGILWSINRQNNPEGVYSTC